MADNSPSPNTAPVAELLTPAALRILQEALFGLRFGQVLVVVHEGAIVQIERTERKRISRTGEAS